MSEEENFEWPSFGAVLDEVAPGRGGSLSSERSPALLEEHGRLIEAPETVDLDTAWPALVDSNRVQLTSELVPEPLELPEPLAPLDIDTSKIRELLRPRPTSEDLDLSALEELADPITTDNFGADDTSDFADDFADDLDDAVGDDELLTPDDDAKETTLDEVEELEAELEAEEVELEEVEAEVEEVELEEVEAEVEELELEEVEAEVEEVEAEAEELEAEVEEVELEAELELEELEVEEVEVEVEELDTEVEPETSAEDIFDDTIETVYENPFEITDTHDHDTQTLEPSLTAEESNPFQDLDLEIPLENVEPDVDGSGDPNAIENVINLFEKSQELDQPEFDSVEVANEIEDDLFDLGDLNENVVPISGTSPQESVGIDDYEFLGFDAPLEQASTEWSDAGFEFDDDIGQQREWRQLDDSLKEPKESIDDAGVADPWAHMRPEEEVDAGWWSSRPKWLGGRGKSDAKVVPIEALGLSYDSRCPDCGNEGKVQEEDLLSRAVFLECQRCENLWESRYEIDSEAS